MLPLNRDGAMAAYASGPADRPLLAETIGDALRRTAQARPDREAIVAVEEGLRLSYRELDERVDVLARGLLATGVETGDRVALCAPNCLEWALIQYATARVGAILVALNPGYREAELEYALAHSGSRLLFARAASPRYRAMLEALGGRLDAGSSASSSSASSKRWLGAPFRRSCSPTVRTSSTLTRSRSCSTRAGRRASRRCRR